jgi:DNA repair exonuclease SbcCD ATPase subunit
MEFECPICREIKKSFVTFECLHKFCLKCYNDCIYHNHNKCSLCRKKVPEIKNFTKLINNLKEYIKVLKNQTKLYEEKIESLEEDKEDLQDLIEHIEGEKEDLQDKCDEFWMTQN